MKKIGVLERNQSPSEEPTRHFPRRTAEKHVERGCAKWINPVTIQLIKSEDVIRRDIRFNSRPWYALKIIAQRRTPEGLLLTYPVKNQESFA